MRKIWVLTMIDKNYGEEHHYFGSENKAKEAFKNYLTDYYEDNSFNLSEHLDLENVSFDDCVERMFFETGHFYIKVVAQNIE